MTIVARYRAWREHRRQAERQKVLAELARFKEGFGRHLEKRDVPDEVRAMTNELYKMCDDLEEMVSGRKEQVP